MPVDRERLKARVFERQWARAGGDLCDIVNPGEAVDEFGGAAPSPTTLASNVKIMYEPLSQSEKFLAGGQTSVFTHTLELEKTSVTQAVKPAHQIKILARNGTPEMVFDNPTPQIASFNPTMKFIANLRGL